MGAKVEAGIIENFRTYAFTAAGFAILIANLVKSAMGLRLSRRYNIYADANGLKRLPEYRLAHSVADLEFSRALSKISSAAVPDRKIRKYIYVFRFSEYAMILGVLLVICIVAFPEHIRRYVAAALGFVSAT